MRMGSRPDWMHSVDVAILDYLCEERLEYAPLIASRLGLHVDYAETRCEMLADHGLIEPVSEEVVYRPTQHGTALIDAEREDADADPREAFYASRV